MRLLILGGTADGRIVAKRLDQKKLTVIYSIAGLVRMPDVGCEVISGGFTQFGGLKRYIEQYNISAILDVTHPYAEIMSAKSVRATRETGIPYWRFHRPAWQSQQGDNWLDFNSWPDLIGSLSGKKSVFFSAGQLDQNTVNTVVNQGTISNQKQLLRTAVAPKIVLPDTMKWIQAIGPFNIENELSLMKQYEVDVLVSKNSGGEGTVAKLHAARQLGIPVHFLTRPVLPETDIILTSREHCEQFVLEHFNVN